MLKDTPVDELETLGIRYDYEADSAGALRS